jgi:hypothetical protein
MLQKFNFTCLNHIKIFWCLALMKNDTINKIFFLLVGFNHFEDPPFIKFPKKYNFLEEIVLFCELWKY